MARYTPDKDLSLNGRAPFTKVYTKDAFFEKIARDFPTSTIEDDGSSSELVIRTGLTVKMVEVVVPIFE